MTYECTAVRGPDPEGEEINYTDTDYPAVLCSLDAGNNLIVSVGSANYVSSDPTLQMPAGTYEFEITGKSLFADGVTQAFVPTSVFWTLSDPCTQVVTMAPIPNKDFTYTISDIAQNNLVLPEVNITPGIDQDNGGIFDFCTLVYSATLSDSNYAPCVDVVSSPTTKDFDIECDASNTVSVLGT